MTLKGTFRDGVVYLSDVDHSALRNGDRVTVTPDRKSKSAPRRASTRPSKKERLAAVDAAFGLWKNRAEWRGKSSTQIVAALRRRTAERQRVR